MADFAPNFTCRLKTTYRVLGRTHSFTFRAGVGDTILDAPTHVARVEAWLNALESQLFSSFTILSSSWCQNDEDLYLPVLPPTGIVGAGSEGSVLPERGILSVSFVGRSAGGQRASVYLYGFVSNVVSIAAQGDFRILASENAGVAAAIAVLNDASTHFVGSDGTEVLWYPYVNLKYNDHWLRKVRTGS